MNPTLIVIVVALAVLAAAGAFLFLRLRPKAEEPILNFACPACKRKLRFRQRQAGHRGQCPRCKADLIFPVLPGGQSNG
jgi:hypothetical protein